MKDCGSYPSTHHRGGSTTLEHNASDPTTLLDADRTESEIKAIVEAHLNKYGKIARRSNGMCGSVYFFDQGANVHPKWVAAKIPRVPSSDRAERNGRFIREMELQHRTFRHQFVCWPADYLMVLDTPVAIYRASDSDLSTLIPDPGFTAAGRLAFLAYLCSALRHCRSKGIKCHQDLKPQNILVVDLNKRQHGLPDVDAFTVPQLADFGLANTSLDLDRPEGARPYMAPEQWLEKSAIAASDVFSLGVIIHETMTGGHHPFGGIVREWWPEPAPGNSKKWLRDEMWKKWAQQGCPIAPAPYMAEGVDGLVQRCLSPKPDDRPSLERLQDALFKALERIDGEAAQQARFQVFHADHDQTSGAWPYRDEQLKRLRSAVERLEACPPDQSSKSQA